MGGCFVEIRVRCQQEDEEGNPTYSTPIPVWSGFNSLTHEKLPLTRIGSPPLLAAPAHEWNTMLTFLMQAQSINAQVMGPGKTTVITLDLGLYLPAKRLQMSRNDLNHIILRPGELHVVMAMLRTLGAYIENSGIDLCWVEGDLYGPTTVKQIIDGNHVKRGLTAHLVTLQVLFGFYQEAFFEAQDPKTVDEIKRYAEHLARACNKAEVEEVSESKKIMMDGLKSLDVEAKMNSFDEKYGQFPQFVVFRHYMEMVIEMLLFICAVRTGDWALHLSSLQKFTSYFFAHDRINYARMIPLYLAEMHHLPQSDPEIYEEFLDGNWVVNKNSDVAFCALGADHALDKINRSMKVLGGLVGITLNPTARTKFFLIAPELARLAEEAKEMSGATPQTENPQHHSLAASVNSREEKSIRKLKKTMENFANPFVKESENLFNIVTKVVMPDKVKNDLMEQSKIGQKLFDTFVKERIQSGKINIWSRMTKQKLQTWKAVTKKIKVTSKSEIVELREDRNLFARMLIVCRGRPEINIQEAVGAYEFSVVPRSLFAPDGGMLHCSTKSVLMTILEKLPSVINQEPTADDNPAKERMHVVIVDAMAEVQKLDKPEWIKTCSHLADHFVGCILKKYGDSDEIRLIFDRYDLPSSLKEATRAKRRGNLDSVHYHITPSTHIAKVNMKKLLSHNSTKQELTEYLSKKIIEQAKLRDIGVVVAWGCKCEGTKKDMTYLSSNQEEADTKIILHAIDATAKGATELQIHSPDTDDY